MPIWPCQRPSWSEKIPARSCDERLVPPTGNQPGGVSLIWAQTLLGVAALPVQYSAYPVYGSALAEMSGTSRHGSPRAASAQPSTLRARAAELSGLSLRAASVKF